LPNKIRVNLNLYLELLMELWYLFFKIQAHRANFINYGQINGICPTSTLSSFSIVIFWKISYLFHFVVPIKLSNFHGILSIFDRRTWIDWWSLVFRLTFNTFGAKCTTHFLRKNYTRSFAILHTHIVAFISWSIMEIKRKRWSNDRVS